MEQGSRETQRQFWSPDLSGEELRAAAYGFAKGLDDSKGERERRENFLVYASQYLGRPIKSLRDFETGAGPSVGAPGMPTGRTTRNLTRTLVDTALSRFAKTETRVQFVTQGGTREQQDRAETCTDAANALLEQVEAERHLRRAALHACVFDLGAVKTVRRHDGPALEHVAAWELMFEPADAHRGRPTILVQGAPVDCEALVAEFCSPEKGDSEQELARKKALADDIRDSTNGLTTADHTISDQHRYAYELWRLPVGRRPGRHVVVTDKALVLDEAWTDKNFPFSLFGWSAPLFGAYPESIAAIVSGLQGDIDGLRNRSSQILRLMAVPMWLAEGVEGELVVVQLRGGSDAVGDAIKVPPGTKLTRVPAGDLLGSELPKEEADAWAKGFEMTGISQSSAVGSRPAGLNSAPAQREWNEINQDRLSLVALDYQQAHVDVAEQLLEAVSEMPDYEISVKDPNGRWLKKMRAADLDLDNSDYVIQRFPISALPTTPTGRLAAAADLLQAGAIDQQQFQLITQLPDLKAQLDINLASRRATEKLIARMLKVGKYIAPLDAIEPMYAAKYATATLLEGIASEPPLDPDRQRLLVDWLNDIKARLDKAKGAAAAVAPPPALAGPGPEAVPIAPAPLAPPPGAEMAAAA